MNADKGMIIEQTMEAQANTQETQNRTGLVHIYHGDGKGKTTAAMGLAVRAAGRGWKVLILRLLKTEDSGEVDTLRMIPGITVIPCTRSFGFVSRMTSEQKEEAEAYFTSEFRAALQKAVAEQYDMLVLDEIMAACRYGMVPEMELISFLEQRPGGMEVILTGRDPSDAVKTKGDYISEVRMEKHPYSEGITAREGIEY